MKQTWGFAWFSAALSAIVLVAMLFGGPEPSLPTLLCFLPVVFFMVARAIKELTDRVAYLESVCKIKALALKMKTDLRNVRQIRRHASACSLLKMLIRQVKRNEYDQLLGLMRQLNPLDPEASEEDMNMQLFEKGDENCKSNFGQPGRRFE